LGVGKGSDFSRANDYKTFIRLQPLRFAFLSSDFSGMTAFDKAIKASGSAIRVQETTV